MVIANTVVINALLMPVSVSSQVILKDVDSLLYVDTDVLFLRPMDDIWSLLKSFNSTQLAAMAPEHEVPKIGWYSRFARHPFYGVTGVNSGVMLMNLTRIRSTLFKVRSKQSGVCSHSDQQKAKASCNFLFAFWRVLFDELKSQAECSEWAVIEAFWLPRSRRTLLPSELNLAAPQLSILPADCNWKRECKCAPPLMMCFLEKKKNKNTALELFASEMWLLVFQNSMIPSGLSWEDLLHPLYQKYKNHITWGDQDLLNIIFHYNPGTVRAACLTCHLQWS